MAVPWLRRLVTGLSQRRLGFDPRPVRVGFVVEKVAQGRVFLRVFRVFPYQYHSTNSPYPSSGTCCSYQKDKRAKTRSLPKSNVLSKIEDNSLESTSYFILKATFHVQERLSTRSFPAQNRFVLYRVYSKSTLYSRIPDFRSLSGCNPS